MKKYLGYAGLALLLFVASCTKEEDTSSPTYDARDKLVGTWSCTENSQVFGKRTFAISIKKANGDNVTVLISNFNQLGSGTATLMSISTNTLSISSQIVDGNNISGSGSCTSTGSPINLSYTVDDGQTKDNCTATCTK